MLCARCVRPAFVARDSEAVATRHGGGGRWTAAVVVAAVAVGACSRSRTNIAAPATTTTRPAPTTSTTVDPKQQVIAAYENYWKQYGRVTSDPSGRPDDPVLLGTVTAEFAKQMKLNIFGLRQLHRYTKGEVVVHPQQVDIQGSTASLLTCNRDDSDQYDQNGNDLSAHPGIGKPMQAKAALVISVSGRWLVNQNYLTGATCVF
jgi:hypothetical protein